MRWRSFGRWLLAAVAVAALAVAVAVVWLPGLVPAGLRTMLRGLVEEFAGVIGPALLLAGIGALVLLLVAGLLLYGQFDGDGNGRPASFAVTERLRARRVAVTGEEFTRGLADGIGAMDVFDERPPDDIEGLERFKEVAVRVLGRSDDLTPQEARSRLTTGAWTEDSRAAMAFAAITPPLRDRVADRFRRQHRYERAIRAALTALEGRVETSQPTRDRTDESEPKPEDGRKVDHSPQLPADDGDEPLAETLSNRVASTTVSINGGESVGSLSAGLVAAAGAVALALLTSIAEVYLLGVVGVGYSAFAWLTSIPDHDLQVRRELDAATTLPGDTVEVRMTVKNVGDRTVTDLRVVDGVPEALPVVDGSPSGYTALRPGEETTLTYTLRTKRGVHPFTEAALVVRDSSGTSEATARCDLDLEVTCRALLEELPLAEQTLQRVGQVSTDEGGSGVEFFATREYRHGDPQSRIDWNRLAKTGSLTTIQYREQRVATVAVLVDDRPVARRALDERALEALDLGIYAAERALGALTAEGNRTALLRLSTSGADAVPPGSGETHTTRVRAALREQSETFAAIDRGRADGAGEPREEVDWPTLERRLPTNGQVLFVSPALDDTVLTMAEKVAATGREVTLLSPDVTEGSTLGHRVEALDRAVRLQAVRETGTRVVDWHPDDPVQVAVSRALALWRD